MKTILVQYMLYTLNEIYSRDKSKEILVFADLSMVVTLEHVCI